MVEPRFVIFLDSIGDFRFRLVAENGEIIAASQGYDEKTSCRKGIESVKHNVGEAEIYDLIAGQESAGGSKFEVFKDSKEEFRFRLIAGNEEIIAASQGYDAKVSCLNGVESVKRNAPRAVTVDTTPTTSPREEPRVATVVPPVVPVATAPTIAPREKHGVLWVIFSRLIYSYFFRGMWWRDSMTGSDFREQYPYEE